MILLPFNNLPGFSQFFLDYVDDYSKVSSFFQVNRFDDRLIRNQMEPIASRYPYRDQLARILTRQNQVFGNARQALDNSALLASPNTVAVVTGQQMGLFTGPLFTITKALATVKWCRSYQDKYPQYNFVPIFWMELEDHDFGEVRSASLFSLQNELVTVSYEGFDVENKRKTPVGRIILNESIQQSIEQLRASFQPSGFTENILQIAGKAYAPGETLGSAFGKLMAILLGHTGLVLCDPSDPELKQMAAPVFYKELTDSQITNRVLAEQSGRLSSNGYHVQVEAQPTNLFLLDDGSAPFNTTGAEKVRISAETVANHRNWLLELVEKEPNRFIPNVVLRPLVQDHILPTMTYVGGPAEIAYWAQFTPLYTHFDLFQPVVVPRPFVTFLEKKNKKVLDKYGLTLTDLFQERESFIEQYVIRHSSIDVETLFGEWLSVQEQKAKTVEIKIAGLDPSLKGAAATAMEKIRHALNVLKEKTIAAEKRSQAETIGQISKAFNHLFPLSTYQERQLNVLYFLNKYDTVFVNRLFDEMEHRSTGMQVIEL